MKKTTQDIVANKQPESAIISYCLLLNVTDRGYLAKKRDRLGNSNQQIVTSWGKYEFQRFLKVKRGQRCEKRYDFVTDWGREGQIVTSWGVFDYSKS